MNTIHTHRHDQISDRSLMGFITLFGAYVAAVALCGFHGTKLLGLGPLTFDAGLITYAFPFLVTDICSEVYGTRYSQKIVFGGLIGVITAIITTKISLVLPASSDWHLANEYDAIFNAGGRIAFAVICTFVVSQLVDIYVFSWLRKKTDGKYLWLRNNVSTMVGGLLDAVIFTTIAFYGVYPVLPIIFSAYTARIIITAIDTPLVYLGVWILRKKYPELQK